MFFVLCHLFALAEQRTMTNNYFCFCSLFRLVRTNSRSCICSRFARTKSIRTNLRFEHICAPPCAAAARRGGGRGRGRGRRRERERRHRGSGGGGGGAFRFRKRAPRTIQHSNASESGSSSFATSAQIPFLFVAAEDVPGTRNYLIRKFRDSESVLQESCNRFWNCTKTTGFPMFSSIKDSADAV